MAGEDEVETALRLLARVIPPIAGPSIWCCRRTLRQGLLFQLLLARGKHALVVLKRNVAISIRTWLDYSTT